MQELRPLCRDIHARRGNLLFKQVIKLGAEAFHKVCRAYLQRVVTTGIANEKIRNEVNQRGRIAMENFKAPTLTHRTVENNKVVHNDSVLVAILAKRDIAPEEEERKRKNH